jgi:hypothetical protein
MTITVDVGPEVQAEIARQAAARGLDLPAYVAMLLEQAAQFKRQRPSSRKSLAPLFADSPFKGLDLDFERDPDSGRDVEL